ncbi:MAG: efflux RND transporter periplasmic adaptor subunit [Phycisphaerales bacterium]|nr:MAG: efflux RND transporter periplasmic adaptor subunit [Phycisphaerales bacterium]
MMLRIGLTVFALATLGLGACNKQELQQPRPPRPVFAVRVGDASGLSERNFPGRAKAAKEVNLSFRVSGPLIALSAEVGAVFKKGDVVARIDPQDYGTALRTLHGQLEREQARAKRTEQDLERDLNIRKDDPGAISQAAIDRSQQVADSAKASVRSIEASVQSAEDRLSYTYLKAPFDGVVVETYVENFETVVAKQPILRLLDPSTIEFVINVPENLVGYTPYVENIDVAFDALPGIRVPAKIKEIGKEATQATRTYPVTLVMEQPAGGEILPGMAGQANVSGHLPEEAREAGTEIPATAVFAGKGDGISYVWVVDEAGKTLSRRAVVVGQLSRFGVLIRSGIEPGEWIVTKGVHSLEDGEQVRIIHATKEDGTS